MHDAQLGHGVAARLVWGYELNLQQLPAAFCGTGIT